MKKTEGGNPKEWARQKGSSARISPTQSVSHLQGASSWSGKVIRALHSDILDFGCRVAVTEQKLYLSGASAVIGDLKLPTSVAGPVRIG